MKKHTVVIDGAYFIHSRLFVLPRPKQIPGLPYEKFMSSDKDKAMLMRKLVIDFASEVRKLKYITDRIVFVMDAKSWRKDFFPDSGYKANREQDERIDWKGINEVTDEFQELLKKNGVIINRVHGAEGDDLIFAWSTYLNSIGENTIIWTGDKDLIQMVNYNPSNDAYTLWYDNTRGRFVGYPGFKKWLDSNEGDSKANPIDIFSADSNFYLADQNKKEIKKFLNISKLDVTEEFCDEFALIKILAGDKSDNIKSVCTKPSKNGKVTYRLNEKKSAKVLELFKKRHGRFSTLYLFEDEYKDELAKLASREMKVTGKLSEIKAKLEENTSLMLLHVSTIPDAIQKSMFEEINSSLELESVLQINNIDDKDKILANTKYLKNNKIGNNSKPPSGGVGGLF